MSEIHPSAPTLKKGRGRHRLRQVIDHWPLLVWLVVFGVAIYGYNKGIVFTRMNGVVDVYQETIAPSEDGRLKALAPGIKTGAYVEKGQIVAYMDPRMIDLEIKRFTERKNQSSQGDAERTHRWLVELKNDQWDAERKLGQINVELAAKRQSLSEVQKISTPEAAQFAQKLKLEVALLEADQKVRESENEGLKSEIITREKILDEARSGNPTKVDLDPEDQEQYNMLDLRKKQLELRANHAGIIDRISKEENEFVKAGESIVKVVADPTHILGFLPQQEVSSVQKGQKVWVTSATERYTTFESSVLDLSPRIDSVRDAASPLPNQQVRGRTILIAYPPDSKFLPGQPVIIHLKPPGQISWLSKFFGLF